MLNTIQYRCQLYDANGKTLYNAGKFSVCKAGSPELEAIFNNDGVAINIATSPAQNIVSGQIAFKTADTVKSVDLYIYTDKGHAVQLYGVTPGSDIVIPVQTQNHSQTLVIPFHPNNYTQAAAKATGFSEIVGVLYQVLNTGVRVTTVDATETIDFGNTSDPDGIIAAASVANAVFLQLAGALGSGARYVGTANQSLNYTLSPGSDTAAGYIALNTLLPLIN